MEIDITKDFIRQFPRNLAANIAYFAVSIIIGLLLVPYFISALGVAAYGLIPLATAITGYVAIVVQSLDTAISRFLTVDLQQENYAAANRTFNSAFLGLTAIILLMIPVVLAIAFSVPVIFNVPAAQSSQVTILFLGVCTAFLLRSWSGTFTVQLFAYNRLDLRNLVDLTNLVVQTGLIVLFFTSYGPDLALVGAAYLSGAIVASGVSIVLAKRVCPYLHVSRRDFDRSSVKDLLGMGGWVTINQIGSLLFLQIDLIVVNMLFGAASAGEYAIALQWVVLIRSIAVVLSGVLTPIVLTYFAREQTESLIKISKSAVKLMGLALALPVGLICGLAPQLLTVWVGPEFADLAPLMVLLTIHLTVNLGVLPLFSIYVAYNRMRVPGILTLVMGIGNLALAIALPLFTGLGYYGVAAASAIVLTLKNAIFTPWYATRVLGVEARTFTRALLSGIVATLFLTVGIAVLGRFVPLGSLASLIVASGAITLVYCVVLLYFGLDEFERELFLSYLPVSLRSVIA